ncbi:MAG: PepSY-associated TM helix domain-containing protein [Lentimicrobiaceae bacterium]|nr:PepSY-associated TM helix domain-containing protein [Lentimicrobiaceae bacterium]MDD4598456.1 PepSY-associated TM helix domain-containing protein [Lentimicrobiaceae bacterium]HAH57663.1 DNA mismatch repair protein [Bacteroidales bacterium]
MTAAERKKIQAKWLRAFRKIHRITGLSLLVFLLIISGTGILLGWKKHSSGVILSKSYSGTTADLKKWLPLDSLHTSACNILRDSVSPEWSTELDRIDIRKDKGMVKFIFKRHFTGIQLDGATGRLLHIEVRRSDFIEKMHDGSILDHYFNTGNELIKLIYTSIMGLSLLVFTLTGFWLWYGPKRMRSGNIKKMK